MNIQSGRLDDESDLSSDRSKTNNRKCEGRMNGKDEKSACTRQLHKTNSGQYAKSSNFACRTSPIFHIPVYESRNFRSRRPDAKRCEKNLVLLPKK
ncbi:hypothetical protein ACHAXS_001876 [Conticribra weissflogii]